MSIHSLKFPPSIPLNGKIAIVAPSGPLSDLKQIDIAIENVRSFGWEPLVGKSVSKKHGYLAGTDAERAEDLNAAFADSSVDAIWCIRGGYGAARILDLLDFDLIRSNPKPLIGYSDITALHAALNKKCGAVSFHAPTARETITDFSRNSFMNVMKKNDKDVVCEEAGSADTDAVNAEVGSADQISGVSAVRSGHATGRLVGGNLAVFTSLVGTEYFPDTRGGILILEDINEDVYRIDRMLRQLLQSDSISDIAGIAAGRFTKDGMEQGDCADDSSEITLCDVLKEVADTLGVPCVIGLPFGHVTDQWTLPLGGLCTLDAINPSLTVHSGD